MTATFPSRGLRGYAGGFLAGAVSVALFIIAFNYADTPVIMLAYFAAIPLFIAGLGAGVVSGSIAGVTAVVALALSRPLDFALFYAIIFALPAAVLVALTLRHRDEPGGKTTWYAEGNILTAITLYPCLAFLAAFAASKGNLLQQTQTGLIGAMNPIKEQLKDQLDAASLQTFLNILNHVARVLPGTLGACWVLVFIISIATAQIVLKQQKWNLRPDLQLKQVTLPKWLVIGPIVTAIALKFAPAPIDYISVNLCVVLTLAFVVVGLSVVHAWAATMKYGTWFLVIYYVLLAIPSPWTLIPVAVLTLFLGISDQWIDFRRRFAGVKQGG